MFKQKKEFKPKKKESIFIRNAILYLCCGVFCLVIKFWLFAIIFLFLTVFNSYMAYKHFGEETEYSKLRQTINKIKEDDFDESDFGGIKTQNKAYNAQLHWNELEKRYKEKDNQKVEKF